MRSFNVSVYNCKKKKIKKKLHKIIDFNCTTVGILFANDSFRSKITSIGMSNEISLLKKLLALYKKNYNIIPGNSLTSPTKLGFCI